MFFMRIKLLKHYEEDGGRTRVYVLGVMSLRGWWGVNRG